MPPERFEPTSLALRELVARGFFEAASDVEDLDRALAAGSVTFYNGYDPTASSLHVGNLLTLMGMRVLQRHGHRPICLLGSGTALVGDPSGKTERRRLVDADQIAANAGAFRAQFARFVAFDRGAPSDALLLDNAAWLLDVRYVDFLREYGRHFTVNRMIAVKTYRDRLEAEQPLSFLEFNYQLLQAYDFLHLHRTHGCTLQVGGGDQWGNMIAGVELIRRVGAEQREGVEPPSTAFCLTYPLLLTADGKKMGKTERGALWLDPTRVPPFEYYQYWVGCDDRDVRRLLLLFTEIEVDEIDRLCAEEGAGLREAKARLAFAATALAHGEEAAAAARTASEQAFGRGDDWSAVPCVSLPVGEIKLVDLVVHEAVGAFKSKREARQRIEDGAVRVDGRAQVDPGWLVTRADAGPDGVRLQAGRKHRVRVVLTG